MDSTDNGGGGGLTRSSMTFWSTHGPLARVARLTPSVQGYSVVFVPGPVAAAASLSLPCGVSPFLPTCPSIATCSSSLVVLWLSTPNSVLTDLVVSFFPFLSYQINL